MSKWKIVPADPTESMIRAAMDADGQYAALVDALEVAPPYVVTDEDVRAALGHYWRAGVSGTPASRMRAALEAFARRLGGKS